MKKFMWRASGWRLQSILILGFALTAAITIVVGATITYRLIDSYLKGAQDARVGRDMDLAVAFYESKLNDIIASAERISSSRVVRHNLPDALSGRVDAMKVVEDEIDSELGNLPPHAQRFVVITDASGHSVAGRVSVNDRSRFFQRDTDWGDLEIIGDTLADATARAATEVLPAEYLAWLDLDGQARIPLIDTEMAAAEPFDPREGIAGLTLIAVAPIMSEEGEFLGTVLAGHLFNNDFTLVDRIKEVAGVDTATIFFGDMRVTTNVLDESGNRAIGTRVSQEVFDQVLVDGQEFTGPAYVVNQWYITRYRPLYNHRDQVVGILYVGASQSAFQQLLRSFRERIFLIAGATILLAVLIAFPIAVSISRPLTGLVTATRQVARGDWAVRVAVRGYDEMRKLAESFNAMVATLKETQEQLVQKEKLASVGQLAAGVAHEINNPLGSILLYADILHKEAPVDDTQQKEDLEMIIREATRCKTIVNDLLNFSRQNQVMAQETDLNTVLRELVEEARKQDLYQEIEFSTDLAPGLPTIQADPLQIRQVFLNLMNNAAEAMPEGGTLTLCSRHAPADGLVVIDVADTGVGIPPENMKKLFTPFFTTKPIGKGTGLGLAIIYGIVKMHRGQIAVQSEPGKGTRFSVTLREKLPMQGELPEGTFVLQ
ncbi:MAG: cache domain-containing protein [Anaerolineae bacterium]|nr:cache domain-containing protein [Anaerolineae bacterium]